MVSAVNSEFLGEPASEGFGSTAPHSLLFVWILRQGKAGKYTDYSGATGITKYEGQSTLHRTVNVDVVESNNVVSTLTEVIREFAEERQWSLYHLPRNLVLALLGELGELAELVQWNGDEDQAWTTEQLDKLSQELADVAIYLLRFANVIGISVDDCAE